ncbi:ATP-binding protein [Iodobacter sp. LRB]|uniref:ATP-binding protein n=1 Tax=Iodobacter sp. LRB TaxID=3127955 RepID=UPI000C116F99|nr:hypothetical protein CSQ88_08835 [Iodobacter sp. BJB302]
MTLNDLKFRTSCACIAIILFAVFLLILNFEHQAQLLITEFNSPAQRKILKEARSGNKEFNFIEKAIQDYEEIPDASHLQNIKLQFHIFAERIEKYHNGTYASLSENNRLFQENLPPLVEWVEKYKKIFNKEEKININALQSSMNKVAPHLRKVVSALDERNNELLEKNKNKFSSMIQSRVLLNTLLFCLMLGFALLALRTIWRNEKNLAQLKNAEQKALAASEAKSLFLASISHEMRTPLTTILGYTELIKNAGVLPELESKYLDHTIHSSRHLQSLLGNVLDMSKVEAGHISYNKENLSLRALIIEIEAIFQPLAQKKGLTLSIETTDPIPECLYFDGGKWRQIMLNLLSNAIKFSDSGKVSVFISIEQINGGDFHLKAVVKDQGMGIDKSESDLIFKSFVQTQSGLKKGGTGLGLVLSKEYARHMGGDLSFISSRGAGSEFTVTVQVSQGKKTPALPEFNKADLSHLHILLVEDQAINRELMRYILCDAGAHIIEAENGSIALDLLLRNPLINALIIDRNMPEPDGLQTIALMQDNGFFLPSLMVSAGLPPSEEEMQRVGLKAWLSKPFQARDLVNSIFRVYHHLNEQAQPTSPTARPLPLFNPAARSLLDFSTERFSSLCQKGLIRIEELLHELTENNLQHNRLIAHTGKGIALQIGAESIAAQLADIENTQGQCKADQISELNLLLVNTRMAMQQYHYSSPSDQSVSL